MPHTRVYSPDNEPFDIASKERALDLVLNHGWTQTPQVKGEEPAVLVTAPEQTIDADPDPKPARGRGRGRGKPAEVEAEPVEDDESWRIAQQPFVPIDDEPGLGD